MPNDTRRKKRIFRRMRQFAAFGIATALMILVGGFHRIAAVGPTGQDTTTQPTEIPPGKPVANDLKYVGVGGCSAAACHGGPITSNPARLWNCSYTIWASQEPLALPENRALRAADHAPLLDKHNRAYAVLFDDRSKQIVKLLNHGGDGPPPHRDERCIACHSVPHDPATVPTSILADGVGCELCHGPAKNWLAKHTENDWVNAYHSGKYDLLKDMADTRNLLTRAQMCAGCHVGSPGDKEKDQLVRDVNHDLIAAGHPRLDFEFHAYLALMPKHWEDSAPSPGEAPIRAGFKTDRETHAEAWAIGQVVAAEAALRLLVHRAGGDEKNSKRPWPEFSEFDCYACHHQLDSKFPSARQQSAEQRAGERRLGSLPWGTWYFPEVQLLIESEPFGKWYEEYGPALAELKKQMDKPGAALERKTIQESAAKAAGAMHRLAEEIKDKTFDAKTVDRLLLRAADERFAPSDWDEAAQRLLTLAALWDARQFFQSQAGAAPSEDEEAISEALKRIREKLQFRSAPPQSAEPAESRQPHVDYDSPVRFDPEAVRTELFQPAFARIHKLLSAKEAK